MFWRAKLYEPAKAWVAKAAISQQQNDLSLRMSEKMYTEMFDLKRRQLNSRALPRNKTIFEKIGREIDRCSKDTDRYVNTIHFWFARQPPSAAHA